MLKILLLLFITIIVVLGIKSYDDSMKQKVIKNENIHNDIVKTISENSRKIQKKTDTQSMKKMNTSSYIEDKEDIDEELMINDVQMKDNTINSEVWTDEELALQIEKDKDLLLELENNERDKGN